MVKVRGIGELIREEIFNKIMLCGRFITKENVDFPSAQQTQVVLWKPGKGVDIKENDTNLFLFQFYNEIDF